MKDNRELLWEAFKITNLPKFANRPKAIERIEGVNSNTARLEDYEKDQDNLPYGRKADFEFDAPLMTAVEQRWTCAMVTDPKIVKFSRDEVFPTLLAVVDYNKRGIYHYKDGDVDKVCQIVVTEAVDHDTLITECLRQLNLATHYVVLKEECILSPLESDTWTLLVDGKTIAGEITIVRYNATKILKGNYLLGYMGQIDSNDFISGTELGVLAGLEDEIINHNPIWLKFSYWGRIIYIPKNPLANNIAPQLLIDKNLVNSETHVNINADTYVIRSIKGVTTENDDNEWDNLIYRVHKDDPTNTFWEEFTNVELTIGRTPSGALQPGNGTIIKEQNANKEYLYRGYEGLIPLSVVNNPTAVSPYFGWRPAVVYMGIEAITFVGGSVMPEAVTLLTEYEYVDVGALRVNNITSEMVNKRDIQINEAGPAFTVEKIGLVESAIVNNRNISASGQSINREITFTGYEMVAPRNINLSAEINGIGRIEFQSSATFPTKLHLIN